MISLTCFDMAGTTVRDDGIVERCFSAALSDQLTTGSDAYRAAHGYALETMGQSKIEVFRHIFGGDEERAQRGNRAFERTYGQAVSRGEIGPIDGAAALFAALRERGVTVALTTGFAPATREQIIDALGWGEQVDFALSPADVGGRGRPHPDMLLAAMLRAQVEDVRELAVFGDTTSDLLAGAAAGASLVVAVRSGDQDDIHFATVPHTHVIDSVADAAPLLGL